MKSWEELLVIMKAVVPELRKLHTKYPRLLEWRNSQDRLPNIRINTGQLPGAPRGSLYPAAQEPKPAWVLEQEAAMTADLRALYAPHGITLEELKEQIESHMAKAVKR